MADIAQMELTEPDPIDFEKYQDGSTGQSYAPPPEGQYVAKAPIFRDNGTTTIGPDNSFGATKAGYLKVAIDPIEIVGPTNEGYKVRFASLSAKKYSNREGNQILDFLRACGLPIRPKTNDEYKSAIKMASGKVFKFGLVWEAYIKDTEQTIKGQDNFPLDPQDPTKRLSYVVDEFDPKKKHYANGKVKYYVSAIQKQQG